MEQHTIIADVHGNLPAFRKTLIEAGLAETDASGAFRVLEGGGRVTTLGDYIDRGPDNFAVLDTLLEMREKLQCVQLAGNHECFVLDVLRNPDEVHLVATWARNGGYSVLKEIALKHDYRLEPDAEPAFPAPIPALSSQEVQENAYLQKAHARWTKAVLDGQLRGIDTTRAFEQARNLFLDGTYDSFFSELDIVSDAVPGTRMIHGGMDKEVARTEPDVLNKLYRLKLRHNQMDAFHTHGLYGSAVWGVENDVGEPRALTVEAAQELHRRNVHLVIRGHEITESGTPEVSKMHHVHVIDADTGMQMGGEHRWAFLRISEDGTLTAHNAKGVQQLGQCHEDGVFVLA